MVFAHVDKCRPRSLKPLPHILHFSYVQYESRATFDRAEDGKVIARVSLKRFQHPITGTALKSIVQPLKVFAVTGPDSHLTSFSYDKRRDVQIKTPSHLLMSALHKCVRRRLPAAATRIAMDILRCVGMFELLRRFTVVILEDAVLHVQYPLLIWLAVATSRGYKVKNADIIAVLTVVYEVAAGAEVDHLQLLDRTSGETDMQTEGLWRDLTLALAVRASYGGRSGDVEMIRRAVEVWGSRFGGAERYEWLGRIRNANCVAKEYQQDMQNVVNDCLKGGGVVRGDVPLQAFDQHCCSVAKYIGLEAMRERASMFCRMCERAEMAKGMEGAKDVGVVEEIVKRLMWRFWGGVSVRTAFEGEEAAEKEEDDGEREEREVWLHDISWRVEAWCQRQCQRLGL